MTLKNLVACALGASTLAACATAPVAPRHAALPLDALAAPAPAESSGLSRLQESAAPASDDEWRFVITPYAWLLSVDGTANVKGLESTLDEDFDDILDQLNLVLEGRFEAWKGDWGFLADITYSEPRGR